MFSKTLIIALTVASAASAAVLDTRQDACQDAYKACIAQGTPEVACSCTLTACVGEDNARNREFCATATANLASATASSSAAFSSISGIPGGCNPAHPGSCPSSYFSTATASSSAAFSSISGIPGGCNPAHPGSCPSSYFSSVAAAATSAVASGSIPTATNGTNIHSATPTSPTTKFTGAAAQLAAPALAGLVGIAAAFL